MQTMCASSDKNLYAYLVAYTICSLLEPVVQQHCRMMDASGLPKLISTTSVDLVKTGIPKGEGREPVRTIGGQN